MQHERTAVAGALGVVTLLSWAYLYYDASAGHCARMQHAGTLLDFTMILVMWTVMMAAMMLPSAAPMILSFAALNRRRKDRSAPLFPTGAFVLAYLGVWAVFSLAATGLQWKLHSAAMLSMSMELTSAPAIAGLLTIAGIFQWTPLKRSCLSQCHTPISFLTMYWRNGTMGAVNMGIRHGVYCVGCCWAVMCLLFVAGVMNLTWVLVLTLFVLLEKLLPKVARPAGAVMVLAGVAILAGWR